MNSVSLLGRLTRDPEYTAPKSKDGTSFARFTIAIDRDKETTDFIPCKAFGKTADLLNEYFFKGDRIGLNGHIVTGSYENKDKQKVYTVDVVADRVDFIEPADKPNAADPETNYKDTEKYYEKEEEEKPRRRR